MAPHDSHSTASIAFFARLFLALLPYSLAQLSTLSRFVTLPKQRRVPMHRQTGRKECHNHFASNLKPDSQGG
jgi:hypothetical protein